MNISADRAGFFFGDLGPFQGNHRKRFFVNLLLEMCAAL
jgi:hypothetical protein